MPRCIVKNCIYHKSANVVKDKKHVRFYRIPKDKTVRDKWTIALNVEKKDVFSTSRVCQLHFSHNLFDFKKSQFTIYLVKNAIPNQLLELPPTCQSRLEYYYEKTTLQIPEQKKQEVKVVLMAMCWVPDCKHYSEKGTCGKFFRFPKDKTLLKKWLMLVRRSDATPTAHSVICSCHFVHENKDNLPTIFPARLEQAEQSMHLNKNVLPTKHEKPAAASYDESSQSNLMLESGQQKPQKPSASSDIYCRLCLNPVTKEQMICLGDYHNINYPSRTVQYKRNKILQTETHLKMIRMLMPNFDHDLVYNPVTCNNCSTRLQLASDFVEQCMATQKLIKQFKDTHCPLENMVSCEDVVLSASREDVPSSRKKRKVVEPSSTKSIEQSKETQPVPPDEVFINPECLVSEMEDIENDNKFEVTPAEICYIKQEFVEETLPVETDNAIRTNVVMKTEPEVSLRSNFVVKSEPCSTATSNFIAMTDSNSYEQFSTDDVSCNVNSAVNKSSSLFRAVSSNVPVSNCHNLQVLVPEMLIIPETFSQYQNYQNR